MKNEYVPKIALTTGQIEAIVETVNELLPKATVCIFGSRVTGQAKKYSDVDIAVDNEAPIELKILDQIKELLGEKLPYLVDLVDMQSISEDFKKVVERDGVKVV
jgi:predicted nucleotidyltransferase